MAIPISCPACKSVYKVAEQNLGKRTRCTQCGELFVISQQEEVVLGDPELQSLVPIRPNVVPVGSKAIRSNSSITPMVLAGVGAATGLAILLCCGFAGFFVLQVGRESSSKPHSTQSAKVVEKEAEHRETMLRIAVIDETQSNPIADQAAIFLYKFGVDKDDIWMFKPELKLGPALRVFGPHKVNELNTGPLAIHFWHDGYKGTSSARTKINYKLPIDMPTVQESPEGSVQHMITITYNDDRIEIAGLPIKEANGDPRLILERSRK